MNYMTLAVLIPLLVIDVLLMVFRKSRYWKISVVLLIIVALAFWYLAEYLSDHCSPDYCGLGYATAGQAISIMAFVIAVVLGMFGPKRKKTRRS
jgi:Ca2+/H+ antiporter